MRYFDKTFFKFTLGFLIIVAVSLMIMYAASAYASGVEKIVFTTDPQSIKPNTLSFPITIQSQDSVGGIFQTPETLDIQFISTSATAEFLGSTGNPVTSYMSKNTANKTFYYKDATEGVFTITVNIRGRDTGVELDASQQITVSSETSQNNSQNTSGEVLGASTNSSSSSNSYGGTTHVSSSNASLEILAGVDRTTSPGSPIWFQSTIKKNTTGVSPELNWSFGDGNVGVGPLVDHAYKYPGDYVVVLSARALDVFSVSRLKVKVLQSDLAVSDMGEYLEILNKSDNEINLFNWKIENQGKGFVFQPNTIILPHSLIKLDKNLLKMKGLDNSQGITLKNAMGEEVFSSVPIKEANLNEVSKNLEVIKKEALVIQSKIGNKIESPIFEIKEVEKIVVATSTENIGNVIYEAPKSSGLMTKLTNFIKRVFSK